MKSFWIGYGWKGWWKSSGGSMTRRVVRCSHHFSFNRVSKVAADLCWAFTKTRASSKYLRNISILGSLWMMMFFRSRMVIEAAKNDVLGQTLCSKQSFEVTTYPACCHNCCLVIPKSARLPDSGAATMKHTKMATAGAGQRGDRQHRTPDPLGRAWYLKIESGPTKSKSYEFKDLIQSSNMITKDGR